MKNSLDSIVKAELPLIQRVIEDETWLEGERRGCFVAQNDPVVLARVCEIVLSIGARLREELSQKAPVLGQN